MANTTITMIPVPSEILKGDWYDIVYAIDTESENLEEHNSTVDESVKKLQSDFDNKNHWSVSLREVKRELVFSDERTKHYCTLVQFRVRDSY